MSQPCEIATEQNVRGCQCCGALCDCHLLQALLLIAIVMLAMTISRTTSKQFSLSDNEQTIVNRLPPEVLSQIFYALRPRSDYPPYPLPKGFARWILSVASVCRYWRGVVFTTPCLYENIRFTSLDDPTVQRALYARETPLSIFYSSPKFESEKTPDLLSIPVLQAINARAHRLQEFHISLKAYDDQVPLEMLTVLNKPAPKLEALSLIVRSGKWAPLGTMPPLFNNETPALRRLSLCRVSYRPITHLKGLTHLHIFHDIINGFFPLLLQGLAGCPDLEELVVVRCGFDSHHKEEIDVNLPQLRKISMGVMHGLWTATVSFFSHLIIPDTAARSFWGTSENHLNDLSFSINWTRNAENYAEVNTLVIIPRGLVADGAFFKDGTFYITGLPSQIRPTFDPVVGAPAFAQVKRLVIICEPKNKSVHSSAAEWSRLLRLIFELVQSIENITFASYDPEQFRILLSIPLGNTEFPDGESTTSIILPHLRSFTLDTAGPGFSSSSNDVGVVEQDQDQANGLDIQDLATLAQRRRQQGRMISEVEFAVDAATKAQLEPIVGKVLDIKEVWENKLDCGYMITWLKSMVHERPNSIDAEGDSQ